MSTVKKLKSRVKGRRGKAIKRLQTQLVNGRTIWKKGVKKQQLLTDKEKERIQREISSIKSKPHDPQ